MLASVSFVYGVSPAELSSDYDLPTVIALAKAANRFIAKYSALTQTGSLLRGMPAPHATIPPENVSGPSPDTAGFRRAFGSHYKSKLD